MSDTQNPTVIPISEEELSVCKREVTSGRIRIRTVTDAVETMVRQELESETVEVTRVAIGKVVDTIPAVRDAGDGVLIVPVIEEILVVEKKLVLKEELHIRRRTETETVETPVTLRKQRAVVERLDGDPDTTHQEADR
jgi:stress response protein YsnF